MSTYEYNEFVLPEDFSELDFINKLGKEEWIWCRTQNKKVLMVKAHNVPTIGQVADVIITKLGSSLIEQQIANAFVVLSDTSKLLDKMKQEKGETKNG